MKHTIILWAIVLVQLINLGIQVYFGGSVPMMTFASACLLVNLVFAVGATVLDITKG